MLLGYVYSFVKLNLAHPTTLVRLFFCLLAALFFVGPDAAQAQLLAPVKWRFALEPAAPKVGQEATVVGYATIEKGWHLYASDFSPEVGPIPLSTTFVPHASYSLVGKVVSVKSHHEQDAIFGGEVASWSGSGVIKHKIKVLSLPLTVAGSIDAQACTDAGKCVPLVEDFKLTAEAAAANKQEPLADKDPNTKPKSATGTDPTATKPYKASEGELAANAENGPLIDPFTGKEIVMADAEGAQPLGDSSTAANPPGTTKMDKAQAGTQPTAPKAGKVVAAGVDNGMPQSLWSWFWLAFGSGLIALLTPCVYPMVPMTVSFFTRKSQSRAKGLGMAAMFGLSIVTLYVLIGVVVSRLFGGDVANELATHWVPNVLFFVIFLAFGFSFLGYFEITLPSSWSTAADERAEKGGIVGIFFMALTLVVVSFSCTGPIASSILLQSSQGAVIQPVVAMLGFSLAFALPFSFFAAFPHALQALPRSGAWMNSVKVVLGFLELALALKFLSVADLAYHWGLLNRDVYLSLWIVIFFFLGLYLLGKIRFPHDSESNKPVGWQSLTLAIITFAFVAYLIPGLWGAPLRPLSGYLPPLETQAFRPYEGQAATKASQVPTAGCEAPKYADFLHLPHGLQGYFDLDQALACAKAQNKPVFVDFTGHGCTNCREMEARVWSDPAILARLQEKFVVCALYVDDRTALPAAEQYTSTVDGKLKATIGKKNLDREVAKYGSNAQPHYVILAPDGSQMGPARDYDLDIAGFAAFLDGATP